MASESYHPKLTTCESVLSELKWLLQKLAIKESKIGETFLLTIPAAARKNFKIATMLPVASSGAIEDHFALPLAELTGVHGLSAIKLSTILGDEGPSTMVADALLRAVDSGSDIMIALSDMGSAKKEVLICTAYWYLKQENHIFIFSHWIAKHMRAKLWTGEFQHSWIDGADTEERLTVSRILMDIFACIRALLDLRRVGERKFEYKAEVVEKGGFKRLERHGFRAEGGYSSTVWHDIGKHEMLRYRESKRHAGLDIGHMHSLKDI